MFDWSQLHLNRTEHLTDADVFAQPHYAFWQIKGPDAQTFLQGQITNDIDALEIGAVCFAAHCNPKGRVVSLFHVAKTADDSFLLKIPSTLAGIATQQLAKYMVFSKAELSELSCFSFCTVKPLETTAHCKSAIAIQQYADGNTEYWFDSNSTNVITDLTFTDNNSWNLRRIELGIAEITPEQSEQYLPQELNLDLTSGLSFKKGCYTGQEIIARLHYRGKSKKRLVRGTIDHRLEELSEIFTQSDNKKVGAIINVACEEARSEFLALINVDSIDQHCVVEHASDTTKIEWLTLPYAIPVE
jgi:folate-binding protein YgfZ